MYRGYLVKLYPNQEQSNMLEKHFGCCRWVYNNMVIINQKRYHRTGKGLSGYDMSGFLPKLKKQYPWLADVNSQSLQIVCNDLGSSYTKFFKKKAKYPKFKKKHDNRGSFSAITNCRIENNHIRLPKLGLIRFRGGDMPGGTPKRFTVSKRAGGYYCSVLFDDEKELPKTNETKQLTGLDLGLLDAVVTSTGKVFTAPKFMKSAKAAIRKKQKSLSRCKKGSNGRKKAKTSFAKLHLKIANQRKDFAHKISHLLVSDNDNQGFGIEDLNVSGMMKNHKLAGAIADAGWSQFTTFLKYKSAAVGKPVLEVDRYYPSSKSCSACGVVQAQLPLSIREWTCSSCNAVHHRDINAALNIASEALRNRAGRGHVRQTVSQAAKIIETRSTTAR